MPLSKEPKPQTGTLIVLAATDVRRSPCERVKQRIMVVTLTKWNAANGETVRKQLSSFAPRGWRLPRGRHPAPTATYVYLTAYALNYIL